MTLEDIVSENPATGEVIWKGRAATADEVDAAVGAASRASAAWALQDAAARIAIVERFAERLKAEAELFAELISRETGKMLWDTRGEVQAMIGKAAISARAYRERTGEAHTEASGRVQKLRHRPHGVLAVYGPYNFPGHLPNGHTIPALIAGNTVVLKPSDYTPMVGERMASLWRESGLPEGVLGLVQGGRDTGVALASHAALNGILFTGSVETGQALHRQCAGHTGFMLALELGGNNPLIVHRVNDIDAAVILTLQSAFITAGQRCTCARRLIVPKGAEGDRFIEQLKTAARNLRIGAYTDTPEPFMGPLIGNREADRLLSAQESLLEAGAVPLLRMERLWEGKAFLSPGMLDVTGIACPDQEYFGPLLQIIRVTDEDAAIDAANATRYGLAAGLISDDADFYGRFIARIRAGVISWNQPTTGASSALPFGGIGISGNHRPSAYYAADYCAYPVASQELAVVKPPETLPPGMII